MSQLGELLNKLAIQSGIDANDEGLKALLSNPTVSAYDVPDAIASSIQSNLLTVESAKHNPTLKSHFYALAYNGLDTELNGLMTELGIDDTLKSELMKETSSTKRASLLTKKVKELESKKANGDGGDKTKLTEQINALNEQIANEKQSRTELETNLRKGFLDEKKSLLLENILSGYNYAMPISQEANVMTAVNLLNSELAQQGLKVDLTEDNKLSLITSEGTKFFDKNVAVDVKTYVDGVLGKHKLIQTKPANQPAPAPTPQAPGQQPVSSSNFANVANGLASQFDDK